MAITEGVAGLWQLWPSPSIEAWAIVATFGGVEALLQLFLPGKTFYGPVSPKGNIPVYKVVPSARFPFHALQKHIFQTTDVWCSQANGMQAYVTTLALFFAVWRLVLVCCRARPLVCL